MGPADDVAEASPLVVADAVAVGAVAVVVVDVDVVDVGGGVVVVVAAHAGRAEPAGSVYPLQKDLHWQSGVSSEEHPH